MQSISFRCTFTAGMLVQTAVLVVTLSVLDVFLRNRVRATLRYWIWMLVFIKLLLPPSLCLPTGIGYWVGGHIAAPLPASQQSAGVAAPSPRIGESPTRAQTPAGQMAETDVVASPVALGPPGLRGVERLGWQAVVFVLWAVGILGFGTLLIRRLLFVRRLVAQGEPAGDDLADTLDRCRRRMGIRREAALLLSPNAFSPAVCGFFRPVILMPETLPERLPAHSVEAILIHELAHLKRGDIWVNCAQTILQIIYFYNPLVWLASAIVRRVREQAVDERVLVTLGAESESYSRTLIDIAEMTFLRVNPALRLIGVAESRKSLEGRIRHMLTGPTPKSARVGVWGMLAIFVAAAILLPMARAQNRPTRDADRGAPNSDYKILLLDDRDERGNGADTEGDRLYLMDSAGQVEGIVTGFNVSGGIAGRHALAVDEQRRTLWVTENAGGRLWQIDLATGQVKRKIPGLKAVAAAVDPDTGNVWCAVSDWLPAAPHAGHLQVVSPSGKLVATYPISGNDIAYSRHDGSFWVAGKTVCRVGKDGKILARTPGEIPWMAASVSVDEKTGNAWVVVRDHPDIGASRPELWAVDKNGRIQQRIDLGELMPFCVAVDSDNGIVWVGCLGATARYTTRGEKLKSARYASGFSIVPGGSANSVIAADHMSDALTMATVTDTGEVGLGRLPKGGDLLSAGQKWLAKVSWSGAKLQSSPELADVMSRLTQDRDLDLKLAKYPDSVERLRSLAKAALMYANDHEDKLPDSLDGVQTFVPDADLKWLKDNVEYIAKGRTTSDVPTVALAYDKTVLRKGEGTLVAYLDTHVSFESPAELEKLGIGTTSSGTVSHSAPEISQHPSDEAARFASAERLTDLGRALLIYANEHGDKLPDELIGVQQYNRVGYSWLYDHVAYLGKGVTTADLPERPVAYDKMLLLAGRGTNVLYLNTRVVFEGPQQLEKLGIKTAASEADGRVGGMTHLKYLAVSALMYAQDHEGHFAPSIQELKSYLNDEERFRWVSENVEYVAGGLRLTTVTSPATSPLAYWKTVLPAGNGTGVAFVDGHVEWVPADRLAALGIKSVR